MTAWKTQLGVSWGSKRDPRNGKQKSIKYFLRRADHTVHSLDSIILGPMESNYLRKLQENT